MGRCPGNARCRARRLAGALALTLVVGGCAAGARLTCRPGEQPMLVESMYFGTARPGGVVTAEEWRAFVTQVVTPRFPKGLTSWEASGQWQGASGAIEREASHVLHLVRPDTGESERAIGEIASRYKAAFQQEAVLRVRSAACASF